jgi:transcriptional regulator with XRE-family HTH domain
MSVTSTIPTTPEAATEATTATTSATDSEQLTNLMRSVGFQSFSQFCQASGVSEKVLRKLRRGQISQMQLGNLQKVATGLKISLSQLVDLFSDAPAAINLVPPQDNLQQEFQRSSLQTLEPWLLQWSAAAYAATQNPELPATKLLPLVRPVENLLTSWDVKMIDRVGETVPYNPQQHDLMDGTANAGDPVRVRYAGYQQADRLLHRPKVSPVSHPNVS